MPNPVEAGGPTSGEQQFHPIVEKSLVTDSEDPNYGNPREDTDEGRALKDSKISTQVGKAVLADTTAEFEAAGLDPAKESKFWGKGVTEPSARAVKQVNYLKRSAEIKEIKEQGGVVPDDFEYFTDRMIKE